MTELVRLFTATATAIEIMFDIFMLLNRALVARARARKRLFREREERHLIKKGAFPNNHTTHQLY